MKLELQKDLFISELSKEVSVPGVNPTNAIGRLLSEHMIKSLTSHLDDRLIKPPIARAYAAYDKKLKCSTMLDLAQEGYQTWYFEIRFSTPVSKSLEEITIEPIGITLGEIDYGQGVKRAYQLKTKKLKKQTNHTLRFNILRIEGHIFEKARLSLLSQPLEQPYIANPRPGPRSAGFEHGIKGYEFVSFDHLLDGTRLFCSCARLAHEKMLALANEGIPGFVPDSWPHQVIRLLSHAEYAPSICHLCIAETHGAETAALRYGDTMQEFLDAYIDQLMICKNLDERTARADVQGKLNLSRWLQEAEMYRLIKQLFPDDLIFREASPPWLGRQRLDVFIPQLKLAFEYQGAQHYEAIKVFGGAESLLRTQERDALKKHLCEENHIELIYIKFSDPLTLASLRHRLRRFIKN